MEELEHLFPDMSNVASAMECTGQFPVPPQSEEEYESRQELYGMEIPRDPFA